MTDAQPPTVQPWLLDLLRCPVTGATLHLRERDGEVELVSDADQPLAYPVRGGVPVLLADEARPAT